MDTFKIVHIAVELVVVCALYIILKKKSDAVKAECDALAAKVEKLEKTVQEQMEAMRMLFNEIEQLKKNQPKSRRRAEYKEEEPRRKVHFETQKGAGVFSSDTEEHKEKSSNQEERSNLADFEGDYRALEEEEETPEYKIGVSEIED